MLPVALATIHIPTEQNQNVHLLTLKAKGTLPVLRFLISSIFVSLYTQQLSLLNIFSSLPNVWFNACFINNSCPGVKIPYGFLEVLVSLLLNNHRHQKTRRDSRESLGGPCVPYVIIQKLRDERSIRVHLVQWAPKMFGLGDVMLMNDVGVRPGES